MQENEFAKGDDAKVQCLRKALQCGRQTYLGAGPNRKRMHHPLSSFGRVCLVVVIDESASCCLASA